MPKVLILYDSVSGNTKKMAEEIEKGVKEVEGVEVVVKHVDDAKPEDLLIYDGIIVGSPAYCGTLTWKNWTPRLLSTKCYSPLWSSLCGIS